MAERMRSSAASCESDWICKWIIAATPLKTKLPAIYLPRQRGQTILEPSAFSCLDKGSIPSVASYTDLARQTITAHIEQFRIFEYPSAPYRPFHEVHTFSFLSAVKAD
jgi:hypothetical protein